MGPVTRVPDWVVLLLFLMGVPHQSVSNWSTQGETGDLQEQHHMGHPKAPLKLSETHRKKKCWGFPLPSSCGKVVFEKILGNFRGLSL